MKWPCQQWSHIVPAVLWNKQISQVCLVFQRGNSQRQWTFYTGGWNGEMEQKGKGMGEKRHHSDGICNYEILNWQELVLFALWKDFLVASNRVLLSDIYWICICDLELECLACYKLLLNLHVVNMVSVATSMQSEKDCELHLSPGGEKQIAGYGAMHLRKWIRRGLFALFPEIIFWSLFDPMLRYNCQAEAEGKSACYSDH